MKVVAGSDWSVGLNQFSTHASADAQLLDAVGRALRSSYERLVEEPVPTELARILERLETVSDPSREGEADHAGRTTSGARGAGRRG